jgi:predicted acetyltransferase
MSIPLDEGRVHATYWWIVQDDTYLGTISLRHVSARTIEKAGGVLEDVRDTELGRTRRYWITL